jgi:hypothetical protein
MKICIPAFSETVAFVVETGASIFSSEADASFPISFPSEAG